jgi:hypothetical protein
MSPCGRGFGVSWGPQSGLTNASPAVTIMEFCPLFASPALSDFPEALAPNGDKLHLEPLILIAISGCAWGFP